MPTHAARKIEKRLSENKITTVHKSVTQSFMPTHVHLLAAFATAEAMTHQSDSWLHYTASQINRAIGEKGKFWQQEPFDHLVRSRRRKLDSPTALAATAQDFSGFFH